MKYKIYLVTIILWFLLSFILGYIYVINQINSSEAIGYEKDWSFQIICFIFENGLILVFLLIITMLIEFKLINKQKYLNK